MIIERSRRVGTISATFRAEFQLGVAEPCLRVSDLMCGAVVASLRGEPSYLDLLRKRLIIMEIAVS